MDSMQNVKRSDIHFPIEFFTHIGERVVVYNLIPIWSFMND